MNDVITNTELANERMVAPCTSDGVAQNYLRSIRDPFLCGLLVCLVVYGGFVFVPGMHIDDEWSSVYGVVAQDISLGRWGTAFIREFLVPGPFNGFFTMLLSISLMSLCGAVFSSFLFVEKIERSAATSLFVAFPQFAYQIEFHLQADVIPLGYLFATVSLFPILVAEKARARARVGLLACSGALLVMAASIYQPIIIYPICISALVAISRLIRFAEFRASIVQLLVCTIVVGASLVCYVVSSKIALTLAGVQGHSSYFTSQFDWADQPARNVVHTVAVLLADSLNGESYYGEILYATLAIPVVGIVLCSLRLGPGRFMSIAVLLTVVLLVPESLVILLGSYQPARTYLLQCIPFAGLWVIFLGLARERLAPRHFLGAVAAPCVVLILLSAFHTSRLSFSDYIEWKSDSLLANRIADSVFQRYPAFDDEKTPVFFYGAVRRRNFWRFNDSFDAFGMSFFEWDNGNTVRIDSFMTVSGVADFHAPDRAEWADLAKTARAMPAWPRVGSILLTPKAMIVRIGQ